MVAGLLAAVVLGLFVGVCSGLLGIGGGLVMVPAFRLVFGMGALASTATSLFTIIPTSISGFVSHLRNRTCIPKLGIALGIGGACLSPVGVWLASRSPSWLVMLAAAIVMAYSAYTMFGKALKMGRRSQPPSSQNGAAAAGTTASTGADVDAGSFALSRRHLAYGVAIGLGAGLVSGYIGVGGGFIMVPLMVAIMGLPMKKATGTSLIAVLILAIPGAITQGILGNIDFLVGIATACGTIPGAYLGGQLASRVPERTLRFLFACFLVVAAVLLAVKEFDLM